MRLEKSNWLLAGLATALLGFGTAGTASTVEHAAAQSTTYKVAAASQTQSKSKSSRTDEQREMEEQETEENRARSESMGKERSKEHRRDH